MKEGRIFIKKQFVFMMLALVAVVAIAAVLILAFSGSNNGNNQGNSGNQGNTGGQGNDVSDLLAGSCRASGGTVTTSLCCISVSFFPNTCMVGACGCSQINSHVIDVCDCGPGKCFDGNACVAS